MILTGATGRVFAALHRHVRELATAAVRLVGHWIAGEQLVVHAPGVCDLLADGGADLVDVVGFAALRVVRFVGKGERQGVDDVLAVAVVRRDAERALALVELAAQAGDHFFHVIGSAGINVGNRDVERREDVARARHDVGPFLRAAVERAEHERTAALWHATFIRHRRGVGVATVIHDGAATGVSLAVIEVQDAGELTVAADRRAKLGRHPTFACTGRQRHRSGGIDRRAYAVADGWRDLVRAGDGGHAGYAKRRRDREDGSCYNACFHVRSLAALTAIEYCRLLSSASSPALCEQQQIGIVNERISLQKRRGDDESDIGGDQNHAFDAADPARSPQHECAEQRDRDQADAVDGMQALDETDGPQVGRYAEN